MSQAEGYTSTAKGLHWISGIIWIMAWVIGFVAVHWRDELNPAHFLTFLHSRDWPGCGNSKREGDHPG